jgi:large-conductance mechanosensitive channel
MEQLNETLGKIFGDLKEYAPGIIKAALLLLLAWIIASIVRSIVNKVAGKARLDERAGSPVTASLASLVYWLTFLFFLPGILEALNLRQMLVPVQEMFNKIFAFIPNLLGAGIIFAVGYFVAKLVRQIITNVLSAAGLDEFSQKAGISSALGKQSLSGMLGLISFVLIIVPVAQAALSKLQLDTVTRPVEAMMTKLIGVVPGIIGAAAVLIISYYLGKIVGQFVTNLLEGLGFNALLMRLGLPQTSGEGGKTPSQVVGYLVTAAILVLAIMQAAEVMGMTGLSSIVSEFSVFGGHVISGVIVFGIGLYLANLAVMMIKSSGAQNADLLAKVARTAISVLAGAMALRQMGIAPEIINTAFTLLLGAGAVAVAIAFGVGGREHAAKLIGEWREKVK